ncbi:MAG: LicD family protein [Chlamydiia bacterium]|nr:LicD family protein [Chlamydiia bacterium]
MKIKTDLELQRQAEVYSEIFALFNEYGYTPIMTGGTLLGTVREGDFIKWDWDAEFMIRQQELSDNIYDIIKEIRSKGYVVKHYEDEKKYLILVYDGDWWVEIFFYYNIDGIYRHGKQKIPLEFLDKHKIIMLRGEYYRCPLDAKGFLYYTYANWEIVREERDCRKYLTKERFDEGELEKYNPEEDLND